MTTKSFSELQNIIGYHFKDIHILERALTHSSTNDDYNYQRLEFLGDRVLGLVMAHALFVEFRGENEGGLAKRHTALVQGRTCAIIGQAHSIGDYIILSDSERGAGGHLNENIIADVVESMLGAVYIDGGYEAARDVILRLWGDNIQTLKEAPQDPKTELQEWVQARAMELPRYEIIDKSGPDHAPIFVIRLTIDGFSPVDVEGPSRRQAEKTAARKMLKILSSHD
ncbi:MAG TPA: ribonuclease III [Alphaproteobacteria bacterium]|nr:ribonuclease III [Alphaproteobacteria bacterium]